MHNIRKLKIWNDSLDLAIEVYKTLANMPIEEKYGLSSQIKRCSVSIPSNIAEGQSRNTKKEFIQFLHIAKGSNSELMTQFLLCLDFEYLKKEEIQKVMNLCTEIDGLLGGLIKSLKTNLV